MMMGGGCRDELSCLAKETGDKGVGRVRGFACIRFVSSSTIYGSSAKSTSYLSTWLSFMIIGEAEQETFQTDALIIVLSINP